jgi:hypothetical protein
MRKTLLFAFVCLVWIGSWSACPALAADTLANKAGRTAPGFYVTIQGKLVALPTPAWLGEIGVDYVIQADGQQIFVSCGTDKTLLEWLSKVGNRLIHLNGTLAGIDDPRLEKESAGCVFRARDKILVVHATRFEEVKDPNAKDELTISAVGNLHPQLVQLTIAGPPRLWEIAAVKQSLSFTLMDGDLLKQAVALEGNEVVAMGTLRDGAFVIKTLIVSR